MSKELFVSSTPHETKVAIVEDDQLSEIYFERENEYTLAGSIYKGRVTRVLPGMQSAFVDVGLERDAFLYVTDFLEEQEDQDEFEQVISKAHEDATRGTTPAAGAPPPQPIEAANVIPPPEASEQANGNRAPEQQRDSGRPQNGENDRQWRGRRRRRDGRRGFPDSKFARNERPREAPTAAAAAPAYEPIILPGESISKYQNRPQQVIAPPTTATESESEGAGPGTEAAALAASTEPLGETLEHEYQPEQEHDVESHDVTPWATTWRSESEQNRHEAHEELHAEAEPSRESHHEQMNVAAVFGGAEAETEEQEEEHEHHHEEFSRAGVAEPRSESQAAPAEASFTPGEGVIEEEEIEGDEDELSAAGEVLEESEYEELEEETLDRAQPHDPGTAVPLSEVRNGKLESEAIEGELAEDGEEEEEGENGEELEEAEQFAEGATAENGRAETRGPAGTAGYQQRPAERPGFDPRRRGRRGGRRMRTRRNVQRGPAPKITDLLKEGQEVLIQIAKEPIGKKGARITSHIALPGRFLVYMPTVNHIGVSRKIASDEERQRLKRIILAEHTGAGGFIVRTAASGASEDDLRADVRFLLNLWAEIKNRAETSKAPALIYHDLNLVERILRDQVTQNFTHIWVDTESEYERVLRFVSRFQPNLLKRVKLYTKEMPLFEQFNIQDELNKALKSKVWLKSGGYIVINQTEALVAIDINTGKYVGKTTRLEDTIVRTNVDAIREIVRQIRLRDLGGIIVIDFIDMDERKNRQKVMQALEEELKHDRAPSKVLAFNDFGLVAITRKRVKQSLERTLGSPCPYCTGTGLVKSVATVCNEIYVEMRKISKHLEGGDVVLRVNPEVAKQLKGTGGRLLQEMEELTRRTVIVKSDPTLHQEQFDIN
jgi:Rne/Rng family ribonuclease